MEFQPTPEPNKKGVFFSAHTIEFVGNLKPHPPYRNYWFMDMEIEAEPIGFEPLTNQAIFWGEGCQIACQIDDRFNEDIPF
ncbi:MAG: hypothetical protein DSM106950_37315 [Stigonema ocellatum SAG 48.90 = DSM 106950]|nr:hypothetical protein [Stigonema ocellatum SAG 48.90 = DSM 106950]